MATPPMVYKSFIFAIWKTNSAGESQLRVSFVTGTGSCDAAIVYYVDGDSSHGICGESRSVIYCNVPLKALTDHLGRGSRVGSFDCNW